MNLLSTDELLMRVRGLPVLEPLLAAAAGWDRSVFLVGGAVRDLLSGRVPVDIDICVEGPIAGLLDRLPGDETLHRQFGTATVRHAGIRYDIAEARTESYPEPGALPQVQPADISSDLRRRDFTVNAIALELESGRLVSAEGALDDLRLERLEVLHNRSFLDDPTRLFRLVRYKARLGFEVGDRTARLACDAIEAGVMENVSGARIGNELRLLATEPDPVAGFVELAGLQPARSILGGFSLAPSITQAGTARAPLDRATIAIRALAVLPADGRRDLLVLSVCGLGMADEQLHELLDELTFSAQDREQIIAAATRSPALAEALHDLLKPSEIATSVGTATAEEVALAAALGAERQARQWLQQLRHMQLTISGDDLTAAGIEPGPAIGAGLRAARLAMFDGDADRHETQLQIALEAAGGL